MVARFGVYLLNLDEQMSDDPKNTRPAVVVSPNELNRHVETVIVAPLSSTRALYPTRVAVNFLNEMRYVILDQLQTVDRARLVKKIGDLDKSSAGAVLGLLREMFDE